MIILAKVKARMRTSALKEILPLYLVIFIGFLGYSLMITVFTPMLLHDPAIYPAISSTSSRSLLLGVILFAYPCGQFFGSPILGALSDLLGRKPVLMTSLVLSVIGYALIAVAINCQSIIFLLAILLFTGLCEGNIVIAQSVIVDLVNEHERNRYFGYIYLSASLAYIIGPLLGGKIADPALVSWFNYATPFCFVCALLLITCIWSGMRFIESKAAAAKDTIDYFSAFTNLVSIFKANPIRKYYGINFLIYLAIFGFFRCYPMYIVDEYQLGVSKVSEFIAWVGVPIVFANLWLTGFVSKRYAIKSLTWLSALLTGCFMILIVIPTSQHSLWITLFLTSLALSICLPSCVTLLSMAAKSDQHGKVLGNNQALQVGAEALSGLMGGALAAILMKLPLIILGCTAICSAGFIYMTKGKKSS